MVKNEYGIMYIYKEYNNKRVININFSKKKRYKERERREERRNTAKYMYIRMCRY